LSRKKRAINDTRRLQKIGDHKFKAPKNFERYFLLEKITNIG
jgi:hypothetical protein